MNLVVAVVIAVAHPSVTAAKIRYQKDVIRYTTPSQISLPSMEEPQSSYDPNALQQE